MSKIVRKSLADVKMTAKRRRELTALAVRPDSEIDYSEIPRLPERFLAGNAMQNPSTGQ